MQVLAITSRSLFNTKWINLSIKTFSPRQFLCGVIGGVSIITAIIGKIHPIFAIFGILIILFGFTPFGFLSTEKKIIAFVSFHTKKDATVKKSKKQYSTLVGIGKLSVEESSDEKPPQTKKIQTVYVDDLDVPYVLNLSTTAKSQFIPVTIFFSEGVDEIPIASTTTGRHGKVSCTVLLEQYGQRRVRVTGDDDGTTYYDDTVVFERR